jgi:hypothetical protein
MKKPKRGVRSMEPSSGGTSPLNSFRYGSVTCQGGRGGGLLLVVCLFVWRVCVCECGVSGV